MADDNPDGIYFTKHSLERSHFCDGRRCSRWYLIDQHGDKHLAVIGTETPRRDGHYKYIAKEPLANGMGLNCGNQSGVYKWLESMIKHNPGDSNHAAQSTGHLKPQQQQQQQHSAGSTQHSQPGPLHDGAINQERQQAPPNHHYQQHQQAQQQQQQAQQQHVQQQQAQQPAEHWSLEALFESIATAPLPPSAQKRSQADLQEHSAARDSPATAATQPNASSFINEHSKRRRKQVHPLRIAAAYSPCGPDSVAAVGTGSRAAAATAAPAGVEKCKSGEKLRREYPGSAAAEQHQQQQNIAEQQQGKKQNSSASRTMSLNDDLSRHIRRGSCMGVMGRAQWDLFRQQHKDEIALARQQRLEARQQQRLEQQLEKEEQEHSQQHGVLQLVFPDTTAADAGEPSDQQQEQQQQHQDNILDVQAQRLTHDRPPGKDNVAGVSSHRAHHQQQQQQQPIPGGHQDTVVEAAPTAAAAGLDIADAGAVSASPTTGQQKLADHTGARHCAVVQYAAAPAAQVADEGQGQQPSRISPAAKPPAAARLPPAAGGAGGDLVALPPPAAAAAAAAATAAEVPPPAVTAEVPQPAAASASAGFGQDENLVRLTAVISMLNALLEHLKPGLDGSTHRDFLKHTRQTAVTLQLTPRPKKLGQPTAEVAQERQMWLLLYEPHVKSYYDDMKHPERQDEAWMRDVCDMLRDVLINS